MHNFPPLKHTPSTGEQMRAYDERLKKRLAAEAAARALRPPPEPIPDRPLTEAELWPFGRPAPRRRV